MILDCLAQQKNFYFRVSSLLSSLFRACGGVANIRASLFSILSGSEQNQKYEICLLFEGGSYLIQLCLSCLQVCLTNRDQKILEDRGPLTHLSSHNTQGNLYCVKYSVKFS